MYSFNIINTEQADWNFIEKSYDSTCYHSKEWITYLERIGCKPFIVEVLESDILKGYFIGEKRGLGFYLLMAPQESIGTYTQGLCMLQPVTEHERVDLYKQIAEYLFTQCRVLLFTVDDWQLKRTYDEWIPNEQFHQETCYIRCL